MSKKYYSFLLSQFLGMSIKFYKSLFSIYLGNHVIFLFSYISIVNYIKLFSNIDKFFISWYKFGNRVLIV